MSCRPTSDQMGGKRKRGSKGRKLRGGAAPAQQELSPASAVQSGLDFMDQQTSTIAGRAAAAPSASQSGGSDWRQSQMSLGPVNSNGVRNFDSAFTTQDVPSSADILNRTGDLASAYNSQLGTVSPYNPSS